VSRGRAPAGASSKRAEFVFDSAPFAQCHAPTIAETSAGLVVAFFAGTREGAPDVGIWTARDEGTGWSAPVLAVTGRTRAGRAYPCWNPVLFQPAGGSLVLFYKVGPDPRIWRGMWVRSADGGRTWSAPQALPEGCLGPVKNKPLDLGDGAWLCPSSTEHAEWRVHLERCEDGGAAWRLIGPLCDEGVLGAIQPSIVRYPSGRMQLLCRSRAGCVAEAWSADGGEGWTSLTAGPLPNPCSGTDAVSLRDGRVLLVYNHARLGAGGLWGPRSPLNVALTEDGHLWQAAGVLEDAPGEYSYPAVIQAGNGDVHIVYTWQRVRIRHVVVDPARLVSVPMPEGEWPPSLRGC
jgi:predicted neuraminidase